MTAQTNRNYERLYDLPSIPDFVRDRNRNLVDTRGSVWVMHDVTSDNVTLFWDGFSAGLFKHGMQLYICYLIGSLAPRTVFGHFGAIRRVVLANGRAPKSFDELDVDWWRNLRQECREKGDAKPFYLTRACYSWLADKNFPGIDQELALEIEQWSLPNAPVGDAVMRRDPNAGPLNARQFSVLTETLFRDQPVTPQYVATYICKELGPNAENIARLEERDLRVFNDPEDPSKKSYQLDVPRIKKRLTKNHRDPKQRETKRRSLSEHAGKTIEALIAQNARIHGGPDPYRPLLYRAEPRTFHREREGKEEIQWRYGAQKIGDLITNYGDEQCLGAGSPKTLFRITARRLRYTFGTRLAAEGKPKRIIAELLDHSDTRSCMVYINSSHYMTERLFECLDPKLAPVVSEFMGRIRKREKSDLVVEGEAYSGEAFGGIGACGCGKYCAYLPGFNCYGCPHFHPFEDAPHKGMLQEAYSIRGKYSDSENSSNAGVEQIDRAIMGIKAVIEATARIKQESPEARKENGPFFTSAIEVSAQRVDEPKN